MKILLSGSNGYIGTVLGQILLECGNEVVGFDSRPLRQGLFKMDRPEIPYIIKNTCEITCEDLEGFDAVCHLAGPQNDPPGNGGNEQFYSNNIQASVRLANLARQACVKRFVFSSSCSVYGIADDEMLTEKAKTNPLTPYAESKLIIERNISTMADDRFSPTFLRLSTAYGISPQHRFDLLLNHMVAWAFTTGKIIVKNNGNLWRPLVHIDDISLAFASVLQAKRNLVHNQVFNVGVTSDNLRIKDIASILKHVITGCEILVTDEESADKRSYRVNCDKLPCMIPAFQPRWNVQKGIHELYHAYMEKGLTLDALENIHGNKNI